jgi:hypothetical protein
VNPPRAIKAIGIQVVTTAAQSAQPAQPALRHLRKVADLLQERSGAASLGSKRHGVARSAAAGISIGLMRTANIALLMNTQHSNGGAHLILGANEESIFTDDGDGDPVVGEEEWPPHLIAILGPALQAALPRSLHDFKNFAKHLTPFRRGVVIMFFPAE